MNKGVDYGLIALGVVFFTGGILAVKYSKALRAAIRARYYRETIEIGSLEDIPDLDREVLRASLVQLETCDFSEQRVWKVRPSSHERTAKVFIEASHISEPIRVWLRMGVEANEPKCVMRFETITTYGTEILTANAVDAFMSIEGTKNDSVVCATTDIKKLFQRHRSRMADAVSSGAVITLPRAQEIVAYENSRCERRWQCLLRSGKVHEVSSGKAVPKFGAAAKRAFASLWTTKVKT